VRSRIAFGRYLFGVYAIAAAALGAIAFYAGEAGRFDLAKDGVWFLLMAAVPGVAGHGLLNWSVRRTRSYVVNAAVLGEPILATLLAWWIFGERPGAALYAGGALVVAGLAWVLGEEGKRVRVRPTGTGQDPTVPTPEL
jgi:drug/metabolite transporter (DMT)-like permease